MTSDVIIKELSDVITQVASDVIIKEVSDVIPVLPARESSSSPTEQFREPPVRQPAVFGQN